MISYLFNCMLLLLMCLGYSFNPLHTFTFTVPPPHLLMMDPLLCMDALLAVAWLMKSSYECPAAVINIVQLDLCQLTPFYETCMHALANQNFTSAHANCVCDLYTNTVISKSVS